MVEVITSLAGWIDTILSFEIAGISFYVLVLLSFIGVAIKIIVDASRK
jgi:hypothetical protein